MTRRLREVAVIFQQFNLVNRLTALENVLAGRLGYVSAWRGWLRRFDRSDRLLALECLDRVGLMDVAMRRADTLSGGQSSASPSPAPWRNVQRSLSPMSR
jgi:phosphonate transport system ATP-binding protein